MSNRMRPSSVKVKADPIVTGVVGLAGVEGAFTALGDAERHAKILINPGMAGADIKAPSWE